MSRHSTYKQCYHSLIFLTIKIKYIRAYKHGSQTHFILKSNLKKYFFLLLETCYSYFRLSWNVTSSGKPCLILPSAHHPRCLLGFSHTVGPVSSCYDGLQWTRSDHAGSAWMSRAVIYTFNVHYHQQYWFLILQDTLGIEHTVLFLLSIYSTWVITQAPYRTIPEWGKCLFNF